MIRKKDIETLAKEEHERYCKEKRSDGWTYGEVKDEKNKKNPNLVAYEKLPEDVKEYNRKEIMKIPEILTTAGFGLIRGN